MLLQQRSATPCIANQTWGSDASGESVWVAHGCRASFRCANNRSIPCGSATDYLVHRWCSCWPIQPQDELAGTTADPVLRRWNEDIENQIAVPTLPWHKCPSDASGCRAVLSKRSRFGLEAWGGLREQWSLAWSELGIAPLDEALVNATLSSMLLSTRPHPKAGHVTCETRFGGRHIVYVQVYKSNTLGICENLYALGTNTSAAAAAAAAAARHHSPAKALAAAAAAARAGSVVFSVVRHPVSHFISGYAEVSLRATGKTGYSATLNDAAQYSHYNEERAWYSFTAKPFGSEQRARAFVRDMVRGRLRAWLPKRESMDIHAFPQVSFLAPIERLDFVSEMEDMHAAWTTLADAVVPAGPDDPHRASWPRYERKADGHARTSRHADNRDRAAMERLLPTDCSTTEALAVHRMLLPDFVCLGYALSEACAAKLGPHRVACPLSVPVRGQLRQYSTTT